MSFLTPVLPLSDILKQTGQFDCLGKKIDSESIWFPFRGLPIAIEMLLLLVNTILMTAVGIGLDKCMQKKPEDYK